MTIQSDWRLKLAKVKTGTARKMKRDYLAGKTIPELMEIYQMSRRMIYLWIVPTEEEKEIHVQRVKELNKFGPPKGRRKRIKVTKLEKTEY